MPTNIQKLAKMLNDFGGALLNATTPPLLRPETLTLISELSCNIAEVYRAETAILRARQEALTHLATVPDPSSRDMIETIIGQMDETLDATRKITGTPAPPATKMAS